jgi:hypothetical protein
MAIVKKYKRMEVAMIESPSSYNDFFLIPFLQKRSLGDLRRFQPCQPLFGVLDFGQAGVGVLPKS